MGRVYIYITKVLPMKTKSILSSATFWGAMGSLIITFSSVLGKVYIDGNKFTSKDLELLVTIAVTTALTVVGRVNADTSVYTPHLLPGPDKGDLLVVSEVSDDNFKP